MTGTPLSRRDLFRGASGVAALGATFGLAGCATTSSARGTSSKVQFWSQLAGSKEEAGTTLQDAFQKAHGDVNVATSLYGSPDQLNQKLLTGFVGGILPDLFIQHWDYSLLYGSSTKLLDMGHLLSASGVNTKFAHYATLGDSVVTAPLYGTSRALTINADLVEKGGLDPENPPKNWDELREWGRRLVRRNGDNLEVAGFQIYANDLELFEAFTLLIQGAGGNILNANATDIAFDSDAGVAAAGFLRQLVVEDKVTVPGFGIGDSAAGSPFSSHRAAFSISGNYNISAAEDAKITLVVAKFPQRHGGYTSLIDPFCFGIPKNAAGAEAALEFVRFALQDDEQVDFATSSRNIPVSSAAMTAPKLLADKPLAAFTEAASYAPNRAPANPAYDRMYLAISRALQRMFFSGDAPEQAIAAAAKQARPFIKEGAQS